MSAARLGTTVRTTLGTSGGRADGVHTPNRTRQLSAANCGRLGTAHADRARPLTCPKVHFSTIHSSYYFSYHLSLSTRMGRDNHHPRKKNGNHS